jgi:hypothetical protein
MNTRVLGRVEGAAGFFFIQEYFFFQLKILPLGDKKERVGCNLYKGFFWEKVA